MGPPRSRSTALMNRHLLQPQSSRTRRRRPHAGPPPCGMDWRQSTLFNATDRPFPEDHLFARIRGDDSFPGFQVGATRNQAVPRRASGPVLGEFETNRTGIAFGDRDFRIGHPWTGFHSNRPSGACRMAAERALGCPAEGHLIERTGRIQRSRRRRHHLWNPPHDRSRCDCATE